MPRFIYQHRANCSQLAVVKLRSIHNFGLNGAELFTAEKSIPEHELEYF